MISFYLITEMPKNISGDIFGQREESPYYMDILHVDVTGSELLCEPLVLYMVE